MASEDEVINFPKVPSSRFCTASVLVNLPKLAQENARQIFGVNDKINMRLSRCSLLICAYINCVRFCSGDHTCGR